HEIAEPEIALPSVQKLDEAVELVRFGKVESVIENVVVIRADTSGNYRVLDEGTVVCWEDRTVIGNIFETFGSVQQPFYSIRF
ncbi:NAF1-domain-containing protein, partial [Rhodotorula sp. JG-1b]